MSTLANLAIQISGNIAGLSSALGQAQGDLTGFAGGVERTAARLRTTGMGMSLAITAPLMGMAGTALSAAAGFEQSMNIMQQVSGATEAQMAAMTAQAMQLGAQTSFSAGEAAQGMLELAKAGMEVEEASAAIGGVLNLAAAGGLTVAQSAEIAANAINAFGLEASAMPEVADLMAAAANNSSIEISDMAYAFQMASAVFSSNSQSIDTLSTAIALLGNNGLKGSDAGTSLKTMLMSLTAPTDAAAADLAALGVAVYDASGSMRQLPDILADMQAGLSSMTQQQQQAALTTIFGSDAIRAANILLKEGSAGWDSMAAALGEEGAAAAVADARMKGLGGAIEYLKGSIESAMIGAALPWTEMLGDMMRMAGDLVSGFGTLSPQVQRLAVVLGVAAAAAGPLLIGISMMLPALGMIGTVLGVIVSPLGLVVAGIAALVAFDVGGIGTALQEVAQTIAGSLGGAVAFAQERWQALQAAFASGDTSAGDIFGELLAQITGVGIETYDTTEAIESFVTALTGSTEAASAVTGVLGTIGTTVSNLAASVASAQEAVSAFFASGAWGEASGTISASLGNIGAAFQGAFAGDISLATLRDTLVTEATGIGTALQGVFTSGAFATLQTDLLAAFNLSELPAQIATGVEAAKAALQPLTDYLTPAFERVQTTFSELGTYFANIGTQMAPLQEAAISLGAAISGVFAGDGGGSPSVAAMWLQGALTMLAGAFALVLNVVNGLASAIAPLVSGVLAELTTVMNGLATIVTGLSTGIKGLVTGDTTAAWEGFKTALQGVADIITGTLSNAFTVISGIVTALGTTITTTLSDWGFEAAATAVQSVTDKITALIDWLAKLAGGDIDFALTAPEWLVSLTTWKWPTLPAAPAWLTSLLSWLWPSLPGAGWIASLLSWAWPSVPGAGWISDLLSWAWPSVPGAGWISDLLDWDWPSLPSLPSWMNFGGDDTGGNARGTTNWRGGLTWVGESGRELVNLPAGSRVYSNAESESMAGRTGGGVTVYANVASNIDIEALAYRVLDIIGG